MLFLIANLLIRSGLILGTGALLCRALARLRPTQRHAILLSAFGLLLLWPVFAVILPEISLPVWTEAAAGKETITIQEFAVRRAPGATFHGLAFSPVWLWAVVGLSALAPLAMAHFRWRRLVGRTDLCRDAEWIDLVQQLSAELGLARAPALLIHPGRVMPMVSGVRRPRIVLPNECKDWTDTRRRVVLLHELAHIVRRDLLTQRCARVIAAVWWFQPLAWGALRLLRRESERACDELVIRAGVRPSDYAAELLQIARAFTSPRHALAAGLEMARTEGLEGRLRSILRPLPPNLWLKRSSTLAIVCCLTALALAASAVTLSPESQKLSLRGHTMKRSLFAGLLISAGLSAATIGGSLYDPSGAAVPNAKALLYDPDTNTKFEAVTALDGKFAFEALPAGQYILRVQSPGFATLFREFNVKADSKVDRGLTLELGKVQETVTVAAEGTPAAATPNGEGKRVRVGGNVANTNLIRKVQPIYPAAAKAAGVQGTVEFEMVLSKEGEPLDIRVIRSPSDDLTQSALEAVRQWRYQPTLLNGSPVEIVTDVIVNYTLSK